MRFTYCPHCGTKAIQKEIGDEGLMQYCPQCEIPLWDMFSTCVICAVINEEREVALLKQSYVTTANYVCVAGYIKMGESAEETARREILEEIGLQVEELSFVRSYPYEKKGQLMLGYKAKVKKAEFTLSGEVDEVIWVSFTDALSKIREGSIAWQLVKEVIEEEQASENKLLEGMLARRSIRKYTGEPIAKEQVMRIVQAGLASATSKNRKPWKFVVVQDKELLAALAKSRVGSAKMLESAGCAIVVFANTEITPDVWIEDASIAMSNMHLMAAELGLGSCWIQGRCREAENGQSTEVYVRELLSVPENYALEAILSVGIPAEQKDGYTVESLDMSKVHYERF